MKTEELEKLENADLHVHTKYSRDSFASPKKIARFAERHKKTIAITDHNEIRGAMEAKKYDRWNRIIVGEEIRATDCGGEILAYGIISAVKPGKAIDIIREIHSQGGLAVLPHPFRKGYILTKKFPAYSEDVIQAIDGIEVFNARCSDRENAEALAFSEKHQKAKTRGSDAHMIWELRFAECNFFLLNLFKNALTLFIRLVKIISSRP